MPSWKRANQEVQHGRPAPVAALAVVGVLGLRAQRGQDLVAALDYGSDLAEPLVGDVLRGVAHQPRDEAAQIGGEIAVGRQRQDAR